MRLRAKPLFVVLTLALAGPGSALAQSASGDTIRSDPASRTNPALQERTGASDAVMSVDGSTTYTTTYPRADTIVSASPTQPVRSATGAPLNGGTSRVAPLIENGTPMANGQSGASALGYTGGLTSGPSGSAGIVAGGGGVHTATGVLSPGPNNGRLTDDVAPGRMHLAAGDDARERAARADRSTDDEEHGGLRNRVHRSDDADERAARAALNDAPAGSVAADDDARERAARRTVDRNEEEHGGFWNRLRNFFHHDRD